MKRQGWFYLRASVLGMGLGLGAVVYRAGFQEVSLLVLLFMVVLYLWLLKQEQQNSTKKTQ